MIIGWNSTCRILTMVQNSAASGAFMLKLSQFYGFDIILSVVFEMFFFLLQHLLLNIISKTHNFIAMIMPALADIQKSQDYKLFP